MADNSEGNLSERQVEYAETIHGAGSDLLQLINDILDLSKIEAGRMDVQPARIAVSQLVDYVEATFRPQTEQKGLDLRVRVDPSVPAHLFTDEQRLQQVLRNLLSNSVKFTETGHVELIVDTVDDIILGGPEDSNEVALEPAVSFAVSDTGIGIVDDKIQTVFEAFQQEDGTTSRRYGGTGLGLSISREIAKLLGGGIRAESQRGRGSTFTLFLPHAVGPDGTVFGAGGSLGYGTSPSPLGGAHSTTSGPALTAAEPAPTLPLIPEQAPHPDVYLPATELYAAGSDITFEGEKILIVDDDIRNVFALTSVLEQHGCAVLNAENGRAGLEALERADGVALVLMDVMMPEMDGYATMAAIREIDRYKNLPIIALTAKAMRGDREKSIEAGASGVAGWTPRPATSPPREEPRPSERHPPSLVPGRRGHQDPAGRRPPGEPARAGVDPRLPRARARHRGLGRTGPARHPARGLRGDPAGRPHARHGRLRGGGARPPARTLPRHPDHLPDGGRRRPAPDPARLRGRRRRLPDEAVRPVGPARESGRLRGAAPQEPAAEGAG
jgi:CheY-like chemotaxis protein